VAHDPKARVVSVGDFEYYDHPQYGKGAVRTVIYEDGTMERRFFHYDTEREGQGDPDSGYLVSSTVNPTLAASWESRQKGSTTSRQPPKEKDEGGRRYIWNEDTNRWDDVGAAPPTAAERAEETARQTAKQREDTQVINTRYEADGTKVETMASGRVERTAPSPSEVRSAATANRPTMISPGSTRRTISMMGPGGELSTVDNPEFDQAAYDRAEAQATAKAERDRLSLMIQAGQLSEQTAAAQYKRWFDENVTVPLQRAQEARARATELRQAQEAEDRRQQYAADYEKSRQTTALSAGQQAASAFNQNLQYQVGPAFGEQFAGALNSLRGGPAQQFTADAFTFKGPAIEEVARKATAQALSTISPYAKAISTAGNRPLQVAEYDPSMTPAAMGGATGGPPPPAAAPPDYQGLVNQYLQNNPYQPGGAAPPEEEETE
jgi:hypothetical protein